MKFILEEIENDVARLEKDDGSFCDVKLSELPENAKCGDVLIYVDGEYKIDTDDTDNRKEKMLSLQQRLFSKKK